MHNFHQAFHEASLLILFQGDAPRPHIVSLPALAKEAAYVRTRVHARIIPVLE